jgi:hypothetical protein
MPSGSAHRLFSLRLGTSVCLALNVCPDGRLEFQASASRAPAVFEDKTAVVGKGRWTHLALVYYPHRAAKPSIRESFFFRFLLFGFLFG